MAGESLAIGCYGYSKLAECWLSAIRLALPWRLQRVSALQATTLRFHHEPVVLPGFVSINSVVSCVLQTRATWSATELELIPSMFFDEGKDWGRSRRLISPNLNGHNVMAMLPIISKVWHVGEQSQFYHCCDCFVLHGVCCWRRRSTAGA